MLYEESLNTVLLQEAKRYNGLIHEVASTLNSLLQALKGHAVMSEKLETMGTSLFNNKVPKVWQDKGYPSLKPLGEILSHIATKYSDNIVAIFLKNIVRLLKYFETYH